MGIVGGLVIWEVREKGEKMFYYREFCMIC